MDGSKASHTRAEFFHSDGIISWVKRFSSMRLHDLVLAGRFLGQFESADLAQVAGENLGAGQVAKLAIHGPLEQSVVGGSGSFRMRKPQQIAMRPAIALLVS